MYFCCKLIRKNISEGKLPKVRYPLQSHLRNSGTCLSSNLRLRNPEFETHLSERYGGGSSRSKSLSKTISFDSFKKKSIDCIYNDRKSQEIFLMGSFLFSVGGLLVGLLILGLRNLFLIFLQFRQDWSCRMTHGVRLKNFFFLYFPSWSTCENRRILDGRRWRGLVSIVND